MRIALPFLALFLTASASAQTITRNYVEYESLDESYVGLSLGVSQVIHGSGPEVTDGPYVVTTQYGGTVVGMRSYEVDFVNATASPRVVDLGIHNPDSWFVIGDASGCGMGFDDCGQSCQAWAGTETVPPNSTHTLVWPETLGPHAVSSSAGGQVWPCIIGMGVTAGFVLDHDTQDAGEVRWTSTLEVTMERTVDLILNPNLSPVCTGGLPNSTGASATIEWYGSHDAQTSNAAVVATGLPANTPAVCAMTSMYDPMPVGLGTVPVACLRGQRLFQRIVWSDAAGTATFDVDLAAIFTGDSIYTQVVHRDQPSHGSWNASSMLIGTAQ